MPNHLRSTRRRRGISLRTLARQAEISHTHLADVERGRRSASDAVKVRLAAELGEPVGWLFFGESLPSYVDYRSTALVTA